jgi:hypothetical protein
MRVGRATCGHQPEARTQRLLAFGIHEDLPGARIGGEPPGRLHESRVVFVAQQLAGQVDEHAPPAKRERRGACGARFRGRSDRRTRQLERAASGALRVAPVGFELTEKHQCHPLLERASWQAFAHQRAAEAFHDVGEQLVAKAEVAHQARDKHGDISELRAFS